MPVARIKNNVVLWICDVSVANNADLLMDNDIQIRVVAPTDTTITDKTGLTDIYVKNLALSTETGSDGG